MYVLSFDARLTDETPVRVVGTASSDDGRNPWVDIESVVDLDGQELIDTLSFRDEYRLEQMAFDELERLLDEIL